MKMIITITGMHCKSCKMLIEEACSEISGVKSCNVDYKTGKTVVEHEGKLDFKLLKKSVIISASGISYES